MAQAFNEEKQWLLLASVSVEKPAPYKAEMRNTMVGRKMTPPTYSVVECLRKFRNASEILERLRKI